MRARLSLICSLVLLAGCDGKPKIIGSAYDDTAPDGGPDAVNVDRILERYADEIAGVWESEIPDFKITFTPSQTSPRGGSALVEGYPAIVCLLVVNCPFDADAGRLKPPALEIEYWFVRLKGAGALVAMPDPVGKLPFAYNCTYVPGATPRLECGPDGAIVMLPADLP